MDSNKDNMICESEFLSSCSTISEEHLRKAFQALDAGNNGFIDKTELQAAFSQQGSCANSLPDEIWQQFVGDVDSDESGRINFEQFKEVMKRNQ